MSTTKTAALEELVNSAVSRRAFARRTMAGAAMAAGAFATLGAGDLFAQSLTDESILNFALNLEYLEAEFYTVATTGLRIADAGIGISGKGRAGDTTGGAKVALDANVQTVANHVTLDEQSHVKLLRTALGSAAVAKPAINLEALGLGFRTQAEFLTLSRAFEDLGVSAYAGAAKLIKNPNTLEVAARIALTEGQHAGVFRYLVALANAVQPQVDTSDVPPLGSPNGRLFQVDGNGLSTVRTAGQVLTVAYGGGKSSGGFFPNGVNGDITSA
jgi:Ferritin-like domain